MSILTSYYYLSTENGKGNFSVYDLFSLQINLGYYIEKIYGPETYPILVDVNINGKVYSAVKIIKDSNEVIPTEQELNEIKQLLDYYTNIERKYVLILSKDKNLNTIDDEIIPSEWMSMVISLIEIPEGINTYINDFGLFVDLSIFDEHNDIYNDLFQNILLQVRRLYEKGVIVCDQEFAQKWGLNKIENEFYYPSWKDDRFAKHKVSFLYTIMNHKFIFIKVGLDSFTRHKIAMSLNELNVDFKFSKTGIYFKASDIDETQMLTSIIFEAKYKGEGSVITINYDSEDKLKKSLNIMKEHTKLYTHYTTFDMIKYYGSCEIHKDPFDLIKKLEKIKK
jgi:hypothetical protein